MGVFEGSYQIGLGQHSYNKGKDVLGPVQVEARTVEKSVPCYRFVLRVPSKRRRRIWSSQSPATLRGRNDLPGHADFGQTRLQESKSRVIVRYTELSIADGPGSQIHAEVGSG